MQHGLGQMVVLERGQIKGVGTRHGLVHRDGGGAQMKARVVRLLQRRVRRVHVRVGLVEAHGEGRGRYNEGDEEQKKDGVGNGMGTAVKESSGEAVKKQRRRGRGGNRDLEKGKYY